MNIDGRLKTWGDADFARKLVEFAKVEVTQPSRRGLPDVLGELERVFGPPPYTYWGAQNAAGLLARRDRRRSPRAWCAEQARSRKPFFIWWAPAAPHREDVSTTLMGRPGPDPRPAPRYAARAASSYTLPRPPSFNEPDVSDKPSNMRDHAPKLNDNADPPAPARLRGPQRLAARRRRPRQAARRDPPPDPPARQHADRVPLRQRLAAGRAPHPGRQVPALRGVAAGPVHRARPRRPAGRTVHGQVSNIDFAPTLLDLANAPAGPHAGRRLAAAHGPQPARGGRAAPSGSRRSRRSSRGTFPGINAWDRPYRGVRTDRYTYVGLHRDRRAGALRPPQGPRRARATSPPIRPTPRQGAADAAAGQARALPRPRVPGAPMSPRRLPPPRPERTRPPCSVPSGRPCGARRRRPPRGGRARPLDRVRGRRDQPPRRALLRDHRPQGRAADGQRRGLEHDRHEPLPRRPGGGASTRTRWPRSSARRSSCSTGRAAS